MSPVLLWFLLGAFFLVVELVNPAFVLLFFGIGAFAAALAAWSGASATVQTAVFLGASLASLAGLRRVLARIFQGRTSADAVPEADDVAGEQAVVASPPGPDGVGQIRFRGSVWRCRLEGNPAAGDSVVLTGRDERDRSTLLAKKP